MNLNCATAFLTMTQNKTPDSQKGISVFEMNNMIFLIFSSRYDTMKKYLFYYYIMSKEKNLSFPETLQNNPDTAPEKNFLDQVKAILRLIAQDNRLDGDDLEKLQAIQTLLNQANMP